jgi:hypothetical protein
MTVTVHARRAELAAAKQDQEQQQQQQIADVQQLPQ